MARNYSDQDVYRALEEIEKGASISESARKFGIPRSTLSEKRSGRHPIECRMGPDTVLSQVEESLLQKWIFHIGDAGFPISKDQLLDSVQMILNQTKRNTVFTDNRPGRKWYDGFRRRHPLVVEKESQNLTSARASVTEENLRGWYAEVYESLKKMGSVDVLDDPERIFNMDESGFHLSPKPGKVLARKGQRRVYSKINNDEKEVITTLIGGNAKGSMAPSLVMFAYQRLPGNIVKGMPESWAFGRSPNGWMTCEAFYEYITNCFYPWLLTTKIKLPIVLFVDGHGSHVSYHLSQFCADKCIILIALFPNATHIHQPMDVSVFHSMKTHWRKAVQLWKTANNGARLTREKFAPLLKQVLDRDITATTISNGFTKSGLYPFNADAVDYGQLLKKPTLDDVSEDNFVQSPTSDFLEQFEQHLDPQVLLSFKNDAPAGENSSLFDFWKQIGGNFSNRTALRENLGLTTPTTKTTTTEGRSTLEKDSIPETTEWEGISDCESLSECNQITDCDSMSMPEVDCMSVDENIIFEFIDAPHEDCFSQEDCIEITNLITIPNGELQVGPANNDGLQSVSTDGESVNIVTSGSEHDVAPISNVADTPTNNITTKVNVESTDSVTSNSHIPSGFPKYFQDVLFWPGRKPSDKSAPNRHQIKKEKVPAVLVSKDFIEYLKKKEEEKEKLEKEKADRKTEREFKKIEKIKQEERKEKEKVEREIEKKRKEEQKEKEMMDRKVERQRKVAEKLMQKEEEEKKKAEGNNKAEQKTTKRKAIPTTAVKSKKSK